MTRLRRSLLVTGAALLLLLVVAAGALTWVLTTRSGFDWAVEQARPYLPEGVAFAEAEGRLIGPIELREVRVDASGTRARIERITLEWQPLELLRGRIHVERLALRGVDVEQAAQPAPEPASSEGPALPRLPSRIGVPLPVTIDLLALDDVTFRPAGGAVQRLDRLRAGLRVNSRELRLSEVELAAPLADLEARLRLRLRAPYAIDGVIDWQGRPPGPAAYMAGRLALGGSLEQLQLEQQWRQPTLARLTAELRLFRDQPQWNARLELPATAAANWWTSAPDLETAAYLDLEGNFERVAVAGTVDVTGLPVGPVRARVDATGDIAAQRLRLRRLNVEPTRPAAWLDVTGTAEMDGSKPRFDLELAWNDLAWPLTGTEPVATSGSGSVHIAGTTDDYRFSGQGRAWAPVMGDEAADLEWQGQGSMAQLQRLRTTMRWRGATLEADGAVDWAGTQRARFDFALRELDPDRFEPGLSGQLRAEGQASVQWQPALSAELDLREFGGELNGQPVEGVAQALWRDGGLRLENLRLSAGEARLQARGDADDERLTLDWQLQVPRLNELLPQAAGRIEGQGTVAGEFAAPTLRFDLTAEELRYADTAVQSVQLDGEVAAAGHDASRIDLRVLEAHAGGERMQRLEVTLQGTRSDHRLEARIQAERGSAALTLGGALEGTQWNGRLEQAELGPSRGPAWRLTEPAALAWNGQRLDLQQACWRANGARACLEGGGRAGDWRLALTAEDVPTALVGAYWRRDLSYQGRLGLSLQLEQAGGPVTGEARLDLSAGRVQGAVGESTTTLLDYEPGYLEASLRPERVDAKLELPLVDDGRVAATLGLERGGAQALAGRASVNLRDLGLIAELVPQVGAVQEGRARASLDLGGTVDAPSLGGSAEVTAERVSVPRLGLDLRQVALTGTSTEQGFDVQGRAQSGGGELTASMTINRRAAGGWRGQGTINGERFDAIDLPEAQAAISPDLRWRVEGRKVSIEGSIAIPSAVIAPRDLSNAVQASPDTVIVRSGDDAGADGEAEPAGWRVHADVRVVLGDQVRIDAFGLDADLGGDLRIVQSPGELTSATGELNIVDGTYSIYAQTLTIERGRVMFTGGPLRDPGLDIRAVRRPRDVLVGVNVRGTLRTPRVELFSEPPMEESQVLSYLVVGVPLDESSSSGRANVAAAAAALASSRRGQRLAGEFGIDRVTVEQGPNESGASLVLGRYLSPRLYVGYGIGLIEQANSVRARYELTRRWSVETRSGVTSSADLLYSIETD